MKKIYFAGSIRGGRADAGLYARMIDFMKEKGHAVLTEHVGHPELNLLEQGRNKDGAIYAQDTAWLRESELLIGECTNPSLGVGYELAYAERFGKPCYLFYNPYFHIYPYQTENQLFSMLEELIAGFE